MDSNKVIVGEGVPMQDARETSLSSHLLQAGMQMVVGMGYSVTVSAATLMMREL